MSNPAISVVMTTFNGGRYLVQQIESILSQTTRPSEFIICDDASTDNTCEILQRYHETDGIIYQINEKRLGVVSNFKKAVSLASPDNYIALSDQDDVWLPGKLEKSSAALATIDNGTIPAMIYSDLVVIDKEGNKLNTSANNEMGFDKYRHCLPTLLFGNFVLGCTIMMNTKMRQYFEEMPVSPAFNHDAWITMIGFTFGRAASLSEPLILYRKHSDNVTFSKHKKSTRSNRFLTHLHSIISENDYLHERLALVDHFYMAFKDILTPTVQTVLTRFLQLEKATYLKKKLAFEKAFTGQWIKRF